MLAVLEGQVVTKDWLIIYDQACEVDCLAIMATMNTCFPSSFECLNFWIRITSAGPALRLSSVALKGKAPAVHFCQTEALPIRCQSSSMSANESKLLLSIKFEFAEIRIEVCSQSRMF